MQRSLLRGTLIPRGGRPYCGTTIRARGNVAPGCGHRGCDPSDPALLHAGPVVRHRASRHHRSSPRGGQRRPGGPPPCARLSAGGLIARRGLAPGSPSCGNELQPAPNSRSAHAGQQGTVSAAVSSARSSRQRSNGPSQLLALHARTVRTAGGGRPAPRPEPNTQGAERSIALPNGSGPHARLGTPRRGEDFGPGRRLRHSTQPGRNVG